MLPIDTIKVLVLHHDPLVSAGAVMTLRRQMDFDVIAPETRRATADDKTAWSRDRRIDVIVADYATALQIVKSRRHDGVSRGTSNVLIVTQCDGELQIRHALERGVRGYLLLGCSLQELVEAVRALHRGERHVDAVVAQRIADSLACELLTGRESEVLRWMARGLGNKAIASTLDIAVGTVKTHVKAILQKLDAASRTEAAAVAERRGLLTLPFASAEQPAAGRWQGAPRAMRHEAPLHEVHCRRTSSNRAPDPAGA